MHTPYHFWIIILRVKEMVGHVARMGHKNRMHYFNPRTSEEEALQRPRGRWHDDDDK
jgi:hypothetical protein